MVTPGCTTQQCQPQGKQATPSFSLSHTSRVFKLPLDVLADKRLQCLLRLQIHLHKKVEDPTQGITKLSETIFIGLSAEELKKKQTKKD
jgi:hypothetical protein